MRARHDDGGPSEHDCSPCEVCLFDPGDCICTPCEVCGVAGDTRCSEVHGKPTLGERLKTLQAEAKRFREWATEKLAIAYSHIPQEIYRDRSVDDPGEDIEIFRDDAQECVYEWGQSDSAESANE